MVAKNITSPAAETSIGSLELVSLTEAASLKLPHCVHCFSFELFNSISPIICTSLGKD